MFEGGRRIAYGARAMTSGGWQSIPKLEFPGGALIGCAAGFMNVPRIKGSHNAILSGVHAADAVAAALSKGRAYDVLEGYETAVRSGAIARDLKKVRNVKPLLSRFGMVGGIAAGGVDMWIRTLLLGWSPLGTMKHGKPDYAARKPARALQPHRLSEAGRRADVRQTDQCVILGDQS